MELLNKKGEADFGDLFVVMVIIFGVGIFILILAFAFSEIEPKIEEGLTSSVPAEADSNVTEILRKTGVTLTRINILFPLLIVGLFAFVLISALFLRSHPAFFFIALMILGAALILGAIFSNVYQRLAENPTFEDTAADFNIMELFVKNLPIITLIFFVAIAIILWVKTGGIGKY